MMRQTYAGKVFDFYSDAFNEGIEESVLEKVGEVKLLDPDELSSLPDREFAFVSFTKTGAMRRHFPIHDQGNTLLSMHYLEKFASSLTPRNRVTASKILFKAALRHGADPTDYVSKLASMEIPTDGDADFEMSKEASFEKFALDRNVGYQNMRAFPIANQRETVKSAHAFDESWRDVPASVRREVAVNIAEACDEFGVPRPYTVEKYASTGTSRAFMAHIETRKAYLRDKSGAETLDKIAMSAGAFGPEMTAKALYQFDRGTGLDGLYDHTIADPWASVFGPEKTASIEYNGSMIKAGELVGLIDSGRLNEMFDGDMLSDFREDPEAVFTSLPNPTKDVIASML